nr:hypothetical protein [Tanacetum cinerariifolium]
GRGAVILLSMHAQRFDHIQDNTNHCFSYRASGAAHMTPQRRRSSSASLLCRCLERQEDRYLIQQFTRSLQV